MRHKKPKVVVVVVVTVVPVVAIVAIVAIVAGCTHKSVFRVCLYFVFGNK